MEVSFLVLNQLEYMDNRFKLFSDIQICTNQFLNYIHLETQTQKHSLQLNPRLQTQSVHSSAKYDT